MKRIVLLIATTLFSIVLLKAQQGIGVTNPDASSVLELSSTSKGLLIPRMTTVQMNAIASPANGLMIYNTTDSCIYIRRMSSWISTCSPTFAMSWGLLGNSGTVDGTNFLGTTDNVPLSFRMNNIKAGRIEGVTGTNTALGYQSSNAITTGLGNVTMGFNSLRTATTNSYNVALGSYAMETATGDYNVAIGRYAMPVSTASSNIAIGYSALFGNTTGNALVAIGNNAAKSNTTGTNNTAIGYSALTNSTTGSSNTALGSNSLLGNTTGGYNTALGHWALYGNTTGSDNIGIGPFTLQSNLIGNQNTAIGRTTLNVVTGDRNVGLGYTAGTRVTTGTDNLLLGNESGNYVTTGSRNIILGYQSGSNLTTGSNNTLIGVGANVTAVSGAALTNATAIGYNAFVNASNSLVLGGTGANAVNVGINTIAPQYKLDIDAQTGSTGNPLRLLGLNAGATSDSIISSNSGILRRLSINQILGNAWSITGNAGTTAGTNFIGTTDAQDVVFKANNAERMRLNTSGYLGIGTTTPSVQLDVTGLANVLTATTFNLFLNGGNTTATGTYNTNVGLNSMGNLTTGSYNVGIGAGTLNATTTGAYNSALGNSALSATTTGTSNVAFGNSALQVNTVGLHNAALGTSALIANVSGNQNTGVGSYALSGVTSGNNNIGLGWGAGDNLTTGSDNIMIGYQIKAPSATGTGQLNIGNLLYGTSLGTGTTRSTGNIGINTTTPQYKLDIDAQTGSTGNPLRILGLNAGATSDSIISSNSGILRRLSISQILANAWTITGNSGTVDGTNFIGTTDNIPLSIRVNNQKAGRLGILGETYLGYQAGNAVTSGQNNTFLGYQSGTSTTNAWGNTALGYRAAYSNTTGQGNVAIGDSALYSASTVTGLTAVGYQAGQSTTVSFGTFIGYQAGKAVSTGGLNTFVGYQSGTATTSGSWNTSLGSHSLKANTIGINNVALGALSLYSNTSGSSNIGVGLSVLENNTTGNYNVAIGSPAMLNNTIGQYNVAISNDALGNNTTGSRNMALGFGALLTQSYNNAGVAWNSDNMAIGYQALYNNQPTSVTNGYRNMAFGYQTLFNNTTGSNNIGLGYQAGNTITTGSNNTFLGFDADASSATLTNATAIGANAIVGANNSMVLGGTGGNAVNVGINTTTPQYKLDINAQTGSTGNPLRLLGLNAGATSDSIISSNSGVLRRLSVNQILGNAWNITGNSGTTAGTNFLGTTDAQDLVFKTNNTEGMRLNTSQNLGLGTTSPSYKLDVVGRTRFQTGGGSAGFWLTNNANTLDCTLYGMIDDNTVGMYSNATSSWGLVYKLTNGNIGMGTTSPSANLHLYGVGTSSYTPAGAVGVGGGPEIAFSRGGFNNPGATIQMLDWNGYSSGLAFNVHKGTSNGGTGVFADNWPTDVIQAMTIDNQGRVGIGETSPTQRLDIDASFEMPATTSSTTGVIYKGTNRFIHDYKPSANDGNNTFIGVNAGNFTMSSTTSWLASGNTGIGRSALTANTEGGYNTAVGNIALTANTTGSYNTALGNGTLTLNTTGQANTAVGNNALNATTGSNNTAVGNAALYLNTSGAANTAVGESTLNKNTTGNQNTAVGQSSMRENLTGANNTALGLSALQSNTSGNNNVAVGVSALVNNLTGGNNVVVGYTAMSATTSSNNVGLGYGAGLGTTSGGNNTFVGYNTGSTNTTGTNNTFLGYQANVSSGTLTNATAIGNGATVNASNKIRLGNTAVTLVETYGSFVTISDRRLKTNITDNYIGLNFIKAVRPVNYELKSQKGIVYDGFVAQEIDSIMQKLNIKTFSGLSKPADTEGYYSVSYATFVVPLVNAVKELDAKNEKTEDENAHLKVELERIKAENAALKASIDKNTKDIEAIKAALLKK